MFINATRCCSAVGSIKVIPRIRPERTPRNSHAAIKLAMVPTHKIKILRIRNLNLAPKPANRISKRVNPAMRDSVAQASILKTNPVKKDLVAQESIPRTKTVQNPMTKKVLGNHQLETNLAANLETNLQLVVTRTVSPQATSSQPTITIKRIRLPSPTRVKKVAGEMLVVMVKIRKPTGVASLTRETLI